MSKRSVSLAIAAAMALVSTACGGSPTGPTPPAPPPVTTTIRLVDGLTNQGIAGGGIVTYRNGAATALVQNGSAQLENTAPGDRITISGIAGYRDRNTLYCGRDTFMLWRNQPGDVDDPLTQAIGYTVNGEMKRPDAVFLVLSDELRRNPAAISAHEQGAALVAAAIEGKTSISVATATENPGATFTVSVNPGIPTSGQTTFASSGGKITGGKIEYRSEVSATGVRLAAHEIARTLGINGSSPYPGLMNRNVSGSDFTPAERSVLLLRYTRPLGAVFQGDNDQMVGCR